MYNCFDVAKYFLKLAKEEGEGLDPMKILKLTYIAHGYSLGFFDKPLFSNQVQAWKYGTVIPDLYHVVKRFGSGLVDEDVIDIYASTELKGDEKQLVAGVWKAYKGLSGLQLSELIHQKSTPWDSTFDNTRNIVIPNDLIQAHYKQIIEERRVK